MLTQTTEIKKKAPSTSRNERAGSHPVNAGARSRSKRPADPVKAYATGVASGKIVAGPHVRDACRRHLLDLKEGPKRGLRWDLAAAQRAIGYFRDVLRLSGGQWEGLPYNLLGWQNFVVGSIFGWKNADGSRRFSIGYVETGKGSGKSPLAAGIGLYGLTADGEPRAEIYAAATKKDQAMVLFRDAVVMVDLSPSLTHVIAKSGVGENAWNLAYRETGSWFRPISADDGQSGPRPHFTLLDEIHEHKTGYMVEICKAGQKGRRQPLMFMITNSGYNTKTICGEYHDYGIKVVSGAKEDDSFFAYICALDKGDPKKGEDPEKDENPFTSETCWPKVNPSLQEAGLPGIKYLRDQVAQARSMPSKESVVRRLNFCQWVESTNPAFPRHVWEGCADADFDRALLIGRRCWGGLDLSSTTDLTALALLFEPTDKDPLYRLQVWFWIPGDGIADREEKDRITYIAWRERGHLFALPGTAIDKLAVAKQAAELTALYSVQEIGYDRWRIEDFKRICDDEGISLPLVPFGQGFKDMAPAVDEFERLLKGRSLRHDCNPVLTWCAANTVFVADAAGNRKVSKEKATGRVDGIVASIMAAGRAMSGEDSAAPTEVTVV